MCISSKIFLNVNACCKKAEWLDSLLVAASLTRHIELQLSTGALCNNALVPSSGRDPPAAATSDERFDAGREQRDFGHPWVSE